MVPNDINILTAAFLKKASEIIKTGVFGEWWRHNQCLGINRVDYCCGLARKSHQLIHIATPIVSEVRLIPDLV
jgi:hypothetical protein